jgi:roadblock/LC7 domain-containing protein
LKVNVTLNGELKFTKEYEISESYSYITFKITNDANFNYDRFNLTRNSGYAAILGNRYKPIINYDYHCLEYIADVQINNTQFFVDEKDIIDQSKIIYNGNGSLNISAVSANEIAILAESTDEKFDFFFKYVFNEFSLIYFPWYYLEDSMKVIGYIDFFYIVCFMFPLFVLIISIYLLILCCKDIERQKLFIKWVKDGYLMIQSHN